MAKILQAEAGATLYATFKKAVEEAVDTEFVLVVHNGTSVRVRKDSNWQDIAEKFNLKKENDQYRKRFGKIDHEN